MATRKGTKRSTAKGRGTAKRSTGRSRVAQAKPVRKRTAKRSGATVTGLKKKARSGLKTVREAGGKTWETVKSATAQVVGEVKETLGMESDRSRS